MSLSQNQCPKMTEEKDCMKTLVPYASTLGSLMYAMLYYQTKYLLCCRDGKQISIQSKHRALDGDQAHTQVSLENEGLYVGVSLR